MAPDQLYLRMLAAHIDHKDATRDVYDPEDTQTHLGERARLIRHNRPPPRIGLGVPVGLEGRIEIRKGHPVRGAAFSSDLTYMMLDRRLFVERWDKHEAALCWEYSGGDAFEVEECDFGSVRAPKRRQSCEGCRHGKMGRSALNGAKLIRRLHNGPPATLDRPARGIRSLHERQQTRGEGADLIDIVMFDRAKVEAGVNAKESDLPGPGADKIGAVGRLRTPSSSCLGQQSRRLKDFEVSAEEMDTGVKFAHCVIMSSLQHALDDSHRELGGRRHMDMAESGCVLFGVLSQTIARRGRSDGFRDGRILAVKKTDQLGDGDAESKGGAERKNTFDSWTR
ncbi:hypothetical protein OF83DRAFT_1088166 [Amylostereum chailletii]|nr:hypothetical protein OF83DRAFT_1088166 [Amylostereum chailletii]